MNSCCFILLLFKTYCSEVMASLILYICDFLGEKKRKELDQEKREEERREGERKKGERIGGKEKQRGVEGFLTQENREKETAPQRHHWFTELFQDSHTIKNNQFSYFCLEK